MPSRPMGSSPGHRHSSCTRCPRAGRPACSPAAWPSCRSTRWRMWRPAWCPSRTWSWCRPLSTRPARNWRRCATGSPAARARELAYPGWHLDTAGMPAQRAAPGDLSYALTAAFPWFRPTVGIGLVTGVGEIDAAAAFDIYSGNSHAARAVPIAAGSTVTTRHGLQLLAQPAGPGAPRVGRLVVPGPRTTSELDPGFARWAADRGLDVALPQAGQAAGQFSFDPLLRDLAAHADKATARSTAKNAEYPTAHLQLAGSPWPWRPTALAALTIA